MNVLSKDENGTLNEGTELNIELQWLAELCCLKQRPNLATMRCEQ